jgi:hypothetical protein
MLTGFFKLYKPKTYQYRPIYYDPQKEAQQKREEQLKAKKEGADGAKYKTGITRGTFREYADKNKTARRPLNKSSNIRVIAILGILLLIAYYLIK